MTARRVAQTFVTCVKIATALSAVALLVLLSFGWDNATDLDINPDAGSIATQIMGEHDCWSGAGPEGVIPGHAVYTLPGEPTTYGSAEVGFAIYEGDIEGDLWGFCR